jgi:hypothetical protein
VSARRPIPTIAWILAGGTALALVALDVQLLRDHGVQWFFRAGDPVFYRAVARAPFGNGHSVAALAEAGEAPYRYGRIGMPLLAWLLGLGRPGAVEWTLGALHQLGLVAIPFLAATLLDGYGAPAIGGAAVLAVPGLLAIYDRPYVEPFLIAILLLAVIALTKGRRRWAWCLVAAAILTKETAAIALVPLIWHELRMRKPREAAVWAGAVMPYAVWAGWVRVRVGEFPFLAKTPARAGALAFPGVGIHDVLVQKSPDHVIVVVMVLATIAIGLAAAWTARPFVGAGFAAVFALFAACFGANALRYEGDTLRLLALPQVFALLCLVVGWSALRAERPDRADLALSARNTDL